MRRIFFIALCALLLVSAQAFAWFSFRLEDPIEGLLSHSVTNILSDGEFVWLATGDGLAGSSDGGLTWVTYNKDNSFEGSGVSALALMQSRLLVATADIDVNGLGTGLYYTDDHGQNFEKVNGSFFANLGKLAYDIAVYDSVAYATCFNGGLLRSLDNGETWRNVFIDRILDSVFQEDSTFAQSGYERGRYFSAVVDPYHDDTTIVWAGSAEGVQRLYYISKHKKLAGLRVNDVANDGDIWWYATNGGASRFNDTLLTIDSWDSNNGLPGDYVTAISSKGDVVVAGIYDTLANTSTGLAVSADGGEHWTLKTPAQAVGPDKRIDAIEFGVGRIWVACGNGGLIQSSDNGTTWEEFFTVGETLFVAAKINTAAETPTTQVHAIDVGEREGFTRVSIGTDSGIVAFEYDSTNTLENVTLHALADNASYGQSVVSLASFLTENGDEYWAAVKPYRDVAGSRPALIRSTNNGQNWEFHLVGPPAINTNAVDIGVQFGDTLVWAATDEGLKLTTNFGQHWDPYYARDVFTGDTIYYTATFLAMEMGEYETHFGSIGSGLSQLYLATTDGETFFPNSRIYKPNLDPAKFDLVGRSYTASGATPEDSALAGNFVVALAVQRTGDSSIVWAAVRPALESGGRNGLSYTTDRGQTWGFTLENVLVWNFEFNGDTIFAAADQGLYMSDDFGENWEQLSIRDPETGRTISDSTAVYDIKYIDGEYWVGTDDGIAKTDDLDEWTIIRTFADLPVGESWVTPNPFSPYLGGSELKFHYRLKQSGNVTITIYDFANNIVTKVIDGVARAADTQYDDIDTWNGTNSRGDPVAAGVYLYRLESSSGEELWGKIMVIP